jgi:hypothetical protein
VSVVGTHSHLVLGAGLVVAATVYVLPTIIAIRRRSVACTEVVLLNLLLGWTGAAWACALVLACGPRLPGPRPSPSPRPLPPPPPLVARSVYREGVYLVSRGHDSNTWAIHEDGRWQLVYEVAGTDRLASFVDEGDVPLDVLAQALDPEPSSR